MIDLVKNGKGDVVRVQIREYKGFRLLDIRKH